MFPKSSSKKLFSRPSVGVLSFEGLIAAMSFSSVVSTDAKLIFALRKLYKGTILDTIPNHTTFVIEPYAG